MEIHNKNLEFAGECLIKPYISKSNKFQDTKVKEEAAAPVEQNARPWLRGQASRTFSLTSQDNQQDLLPLSNEQYYELLELLIFHVNLPLHGMSQTIHLLKETPMNSTVKQLFIARL